jgi:tetratricopeptide (TPR) repeat protein
LLNEAGFYLRALGRLVEAVEPMDAGLQSYIQQQDWKNAAATASNLSELTLTVGQVDRAVEVARTGVELADRSEDPFWRMCSRVTLGDALHASGELDAAEAAFRAAEALQVEFQSQYSKLYSLQGYRFCDLLLSRSAPLDGSALGRDAPASAGEDLRRRCEEVRERADLMFKWRVPGDPLLDIALDHLSLGRATLGLALASGSDLDDAVEPLNAAVHGLRTAGREEYLPHGLPPITPTRERGAPAHRAKARHRVMGRSAADLKRRHPVVGRWGGETTPQHPVFCRSARVQTRRHPVIG